LSAANSGNGYASPGWTVAGADKRTIAVRKGGVRLVVGPAELESGDPGSAPQPGATLSLRFPKEFIHLSPGFYMAVGDRELASGSEGGIVRWYWNLGATGAIRFVREVTADLNRLLLPFKLKVLSDPARFVRCDAVVLYVRINDSQAVADALQRVYPKLASSLKPSTPALTKAVAAGVGVAEDPGDGTSFGLHRCGVLAEGLIRAREDGRHDAASRLEAVEACFAAAGLGLDRPYLNPGSADCYRLRIPSASRSLHDATPPVAGGDRASFLEVAAAIGRRLSLEAIWHQERCTWVGAEPISGSLNPAAARTVHRSLGPELYAGTSGLALFLAELHAATGDSDARRAALGAIAQTFAKIEEVPPSVRSGLYAGWGGIALAGARVGTLLEAPEWIAQALGLARRLTPDSPQPREFDLLSGTAGGIVALLVLWRQFGEAALLETASRLGDELLAAAQPAPTGRCWRSVGHPDNPGLTGFSHGASGIGYALFELFAETDDARYRKLAEAAFDYERQFYDADARNWPDLRGRLHQKPRSGSAPFQTAWCHGAPGIALSRMRAYARTGDAQYKDEALVALDTTAGALRAALATQNENFSLCHGMAGNADVLLHGQSLLAMERSGAVELVHRVAGLGMHLYARPGSAWPCGIPEETPGLMLGLAGIGYFYLRLSGKDVVCVLEPAGAQRRRSSDAATGRGRCSPDLRSPDTGAAAPRSR